MKTDPNEPVTPNIHYANVGGLGLTKREYFAGLAMASYFGGEFIGQSGMPYDAIATNCVLMADALINQLNTNNG